MSLEWWINITQSKNNGRMSVEAGSYIKITNMQGQIVIETIANGPSMQINVKYLKSGIYFIQDRAGNVRKFAKS